MKTILCFITAVLLAGCDQEPVNSHQLASGAFGWGFGQKLPDQYDVTLDESLSMDVYSYETNGFFKTINVYISPQRQICMIEGTTDLTAEGVLDIDNLVSGLTGKYGLDEKYESSSGRFWTFGSGQEVHLSILNGQIILLYRFEQILRPLQQQIQEQKNRDFKKSIDRI